jgi:hypothetical protein
MAEIDNILAKVKAGMAKTNLFSITIPFIGLSESLVFGGKGTQLPSSELGVLEIPHRGRKLKVPGQRTFSDWTVTVMETQSMEVRTKLELWMETLNGTSSNNIDSSNTVTANVSLIRGDGRKSITFNLYGAFPTNIGTVDVSFDEQTAPLEYQVTFSYAYHTMTVGGGS